MRSFGGFFTILTETLNITFCSTENDELILIKMWTLMERIFEFRVKTKLPLEMKYWFSTLKYVNAYMNLIWMYYIWEEKNEYYFHIRTFDLISFIFIVNSSMDPNWKYFTHYNHIWFFESRKKRELLKTMGQNRVQCLHRFACRYSIHTHFITPINGYTNMRIYSMSKLSLKYLNTQYIFPFVLDCVRFWLVCPGFGLLAQLRVDFVFRNKLIPKHCRWLIANFENTESY